MLRQCWLGNRRVRHPVRTYASGPDSSPLNVPRAGSGVVRIDPFHFLRMSYKATKPGLVSVLYLSMRSTVLLFIRAPFYVLLVFVAMWYCGTGSQSFGCCG